jgi:GT2 family glycosyltransferase
MLSIIITSYTINRFRDVCDLLDSIKMQGYSHIEVVFVAERSHELCRKVEEYANEIELTNMPVMVKFNSGRWGLSESRNLGVKEAKGEIIALVDDDVVLPRTWAEDIVKTFSENDDIIGVTGPALPLWKDKSLNWLPEEFHWLISCTTWFAEKGVVPVRNAWGHNMAFKREAFELAGNFQAGTGFKHGVPLFKSPLGEDVDFSLRVRSKTRKEIVHNADIKVLHKIYGDRVSLKYMIERAYWIGYSRHVLNRNYQKMVISLPNLEHPLLKRIILSLSIRILRKMFCKPVESLKTLSISMIVLASVASGYLLHMNS